MLPRLSNNGADAPVRACVYVSIRRPERKHVGARTHVLPLEVAALLPVPGVIRERDTQALASEPWRADRRERELNVATPH